MLDFNANGSVFLPNPDPQGTIIHSGTFNPTMDEFYFVSSNLKYQNFRVNLLLKQDGKWSSDFQIAEFSGRFSDHAPVFSPNGKTVYFASLRDLEQQSEGEIWRLWYAQRDDEGWGNARRLPNTQELDFNHSHCTFSSSGNMYFHINQDNQFKVMQTACFSVSNGESQLQVLNEFDSLAQLIATPCIAPDESYLIFAAYGSDGNHGIADLYISFRTGNGQWGPPKNLGEATNTHFEESNPVLSPDEKYLIYARHRHSGDTNVESSLHLVELKNIIRRRL